MMMIKWEQTTDRCCQSSAIVPLSLLPNVYFSRERGQTSPYKSGVSTGWSSFLPLTLITSLLALPFSSRFLATIHLISLPAPFEVKTVNEPGHFRTRVSFCSFY